MTKQASPSDQGKLPGKDLYDQSGLREPSNTDDKIDKSSQNIELLAYFDALSNTQRSEIITMTRWMTTFIIFWPKLDL